MASRRDELNAYTFSRRRTVSAFLKPSSGGADEEAPRAGRAVVPSLVLGAVAVAAFGGYGMLKPTAPPNWQKANDIVVGKQSTTRYVMDQKGILHPVLNLASARLFLKGNSGVEEVNDSVLNTVPHGPAMGIPYAPDWLPDSTEAGTAKTWMVCATDQGEKLLVLNAKEAGQVTGSNGVPSGRGLYVQGPDGTDYLVDGTGTKHQMDGSDQMAAGVFGNTTGAPQKVSDAWLNALKDGDPITFPTQSELPGLKTASRQVGGQSYPVGSVVTANGSPYVVTQDGVQHVSAFTAQLLEVFMQQQSPATVGLADVASGTSTFDGGKNWPTAKLTQANSSSGGGDTVSCSAFTTMNSAAAAAASGANSGNGNSGSGSSGDSSAQQNAAQQEAAASSVTTQPAYGAWAGKDLPSFASFGASKNVYVSAGSGMLMREGDGQSGRIFLLTDSGLKYPIQVNTDRSSNSGSQSSNGGTGTTDGSGQQQDPGNANLAKLGFASDAPIPVPAPLAALLPSGPLLDEKDAAQTQQG